ncbi:DUF2911 domain-containing protein [Salegentibacter salegens]|uniref:DUF2911 domain-containing protein n=1 Tax=Salegentibacter salegens TaxID=143223 RepID=A0A1M7NRW6_9FLAO|nr:DUF2911 domain-containing protein [Salegentibacter salegens]PRX42445.1 Protein of unknown function (DUF2911) [Salegentibacter salegens]SHN06793.1 Protein of unknown function [Salegentibacter salegens]
MKKPVKTFLKMGGIILVLATVILLVLRYNTKAHSPEDMVSYTEEDLKIEVFYNRPYKKNRVIFGNLVPYNEVWRTGANEATTFETNKDIMVDGSLLTAGKYTLWTIPMENSWKVIFNDKMYPWGINLEEEAYRDPAFDALVLEVPTKDLKRTMEQFTIAFNQKNEFILLNLAWDETLVSVPIKPEKA